ncbi:uncharacterized protein LOC110988813 [Acanthaster planci]|uniref:Uncharacterized protein LOC110988813 n=1 Tax=Acanthaster planci TaxID=133434 RepID=A0A8B7ZSI7_ACAPL|nr:uncharacterized protein LOC110988813 [Acanthaster planci]
MILGGTQRHLLLLMVMSFLTYKGVVCGMSEKDSFCEPITQPICTGSRVIHRHTATPITVPTLASNDGSSIAYHTQKEAAAEIRRYRPLLDRARSCREFLRPFLCAAYLPACSPASTEPIPPCRDLCERAWGRCRRAMRHLGLTWPGMLDCGKFPSWEENPSCLSALNIGPLDVMSHQPTMVSVQCSYDLSPSALPQWLMPDGTPVSEDPKQSVYFESINKRVANLFIRGFVDSQHRGNYTCISEDREFSRRISLDNIFEPVPANFSCEAITVPYCVNQVTYTHASLSNSTGFVSQSQLDIFIEDVLKPGNCSPHLPSFLCSYLLPKCDADGVHHDIQPCKELCLKVFSDCEEFSVLIGMGGLPAPCERLVQSGQGRECYNGVEVGPVEVLTIPVVGKQVKVECQYSASSPAQWLGPGDLPLAIGGRFEVEDVDSHTSRLIINSLRVEDFGIYTCTDGSFSQTVNITNISLSQEAVPPSCVEVQDATCLPQLGYSMTWRHDLYNPSTSPRASSIPEMLEAKHCSPYLQMVACAHRYPECIEGASLEPPAPCRELCKKVQADCREALHELGADLGCEDLPSQRDNNCFSGVKIDPVGYQRVGAVINVEVNCTSLLPKRRSPRWKLPNGKVIPTGRLSSSFVTETQRLGPKTTKLGINTFQEEEDAGDYTCVVDGLQKSVTLSKDLIPKVPGTCQPITEGFCSEGVGYTHAYFPNQLGLESVAETVHLLQQMSSLDLNSLFCSPYARPLICTVYFPPCDPDAEVPAPLYNASCRELCQRNTGACMQSTSGRRMFRYPDCGIFSPATGEVPCYDVDEITITTQETPDNSSLYIVDCSYILLPEYQPVWYLPNGEPVQTTDPTSRRRVLNLSPTVSRLYISDFTNHQDAGTYTCSSRYSNQTIVLGDVDAVTKPELTIVVLLDDYSKIVDCTYNLTPGHQPMWLDLYGREVPFDSRHNIHAISMSETVTRLFIAYASTVRGTYTCVGLRESLTVYLF